MAGFIKNIFRTLNNEEVRYLVVGGVAVNLYGVVRATADIDIVVKLSHENVLRLSKAMDRLGYVPKIPVTIEDFADPEKRESWIRDKGMIVFSLYRPPRTLGSIDVFVREPFDFEEAYSRRHVEVVGDIEIPLVSIDDLIYLKKEAARTQDLADIEALEALKEIREEEDG